MKENLTYWEIKKIREKIIEGKFENALDILRHKNRKLVKKIEKRNKDKSVEKIVELVLNDYTLYLKPDNNLAYSLSRNSEEMCNIMYKERMNIKNHWYISFDFEYEGEFILYLEDEVVARNNPSVNLVAMKLINTP